MHKSQHGFAVVEGVLAAVFLAIVGVTILGQFGGPLDDVAAMQRSDDARNSAAAINYSARVLDPVAIVAPEADEDCANNELDTDFPSDFFNPGWFSAGPGITCR